MLNIKQIAFYELNKSSINNNNNNNFMLHSTMLPDIIMSTSARVSCLRV